MKTFDDLHSIWEDMNIEPYKHDGKYQITLMTAGEDGLVIEIINTDINDGDSFHLYKIKIENKENDNFEIKFSFNEDFETNTLSGQHPINQEEYLMLLDIPKYGKRYFVKKSGDDYRPRPITGL